MFDATLGSFVGQHNLCIFAPTCGNALALEHNGDLYACDHYVELDYKLGNIQETHMIGRVASDQQRQFGRDERETLLCYCREEVIQFYAEGERAPACSGVGRNEPCPCGSAKKFKYCHGRQMAGSDAG